MNTKRILKNTDTDYISILLLCLCVTAVFFVAWTFTGQWPWKSQAYNSYILQAQSWLEGRLDLGRDYPYLELAFRRFRLMLCCRFCLSAGTVVTV